MNSEETTPIAPVEETTKKGTQEQKAAKKALPIVRAIDLGWGYTKISRKGESGAIEYMAFPSLAPRASQLDMSSSFLGKRDTHVVTVDGVDYEVGVDSGNLDSSDSSRSLNNSYIFTEQYRAVFLGALAYIDEQVIDTLVVGLPLSGMHQAQKLRAMMEGTHRIQGDKTVVVKSAVVLPQPLGGLRHCLTLAKPGTDFEFMAEENNLIIDPGFLTFDYLLAHGSMVVENRSGAHPGGVSKVLLALAQSISRKHGITYENLTAIDRGLRRRRIKINGIDEDLTEHIKNTKDVLEASVNAMKNRVGDGSDIDNIIILGGGSALFRKTIESFFPKNKLILLEDAQLANVKGFQDAGEIAAKPVKA